MLNLSNLNLSSSTNVELARLYILNDELLYFCGDDKLPQLMAVYEELQTQLEDEICERFCREHLEALAE